MAWGDYRVCSCNTTVCTCRSWSWVVNWPVGGYVASSEPSRIPDYVPESCFEEAKRHAFERYGELYQRLANEHERAFADEMRRSLGCS